jgi:18S rRNA (guanine1575-N7)-methyltransferase
VSPQKQPPEHRFSDPRDYFDGEVLNSYIRSKSMMHIQEKIALRVLELSGAHPPGLILDLGMGAGFSSVPLLLKGFTIIGVEIIWNMLVEYDISELNPVAANMLHLAFRENTFDWVFSVSAFQWALMKNESLNLKALSNMARNLNRILKVGGICVFQLYESSQITLDAVYSIFTQKGFSGKYLFDNPQSKKKKKTYLILEKDGK